jgi:hypothetical protein
LIVIRRAFDFIQQYIPGGMLLPSPQRVSPLRNDTA